MDRLAVSQLKIDQVIDLETVRLIEWSFVHLIGQHLICGIRTSDHDKSLDHHFDEGIGRENGHNDHHVDEENHDDVAIEKLSGDEIDDRDDDDLEIEIDNAEEDFDYETDENKISSYNHEISKTHDGNDHHLENSIDCLIDCLIACWHDLALDLDRD